MTMDEPIRCPQGGAPARITERFRLGSTAGPVEHLKIGCGNHHWLTPLAETLPAPGPTPSRRQRSPRPLGPVLMGARRRLGAASPQPRRWRR
jgi:hypothetical protein